MTQNKETNKKPLDTKKFNRAVGVMIIYTVIIFLLLFYIRSFNNTIVKWIFLLFVLSGVIGWITYFCSNKLIDINYDTSNTYQMVLVICLLGISAQFVIIMNIILNNNEICFWNTHNSRMESFVNTYRGGMKTYAPPSANSSKHYVCVLTEWGISHFILYTVIGFCIPKKWWFSFSLGCLWELLEWFINVYDILDIPLNALGLAVGVGTRVLTYNK